MENLISSKIEITLKREPNEYDVVSQKGESTLNG
jgi:hypothetical protein